MRLIIEGDNLKVMGGAVVAPEAVTKRLEQLYFSSDDLRADIVARTPTFQVWCDTNDGPKLAGSGEQLPAIRYGSTGSASGNLVKLLTPEHPYFGGTISVEHVDAQVAAAPLVKNVVAKVASSLNVDTSPMWSTGKSTLDPPSMALLLYLIGPGGAGSRKLIDEYRKWYYTEYGRQCNIPSPPGTPNGAPRNQEPITDAEIAALIAS